MNSLWSTIKIGFLGIGAVAIALFVQNPATAQKQKQQPPPKVVPVKQPPATTTVLRPATVRPNRTLSNYSQTIANPNNPFNPSNQLQNQAQLFYQAQANQQLNTVTAILGNNLAPLAGSGGLFATPGFNLGGNWGQGGFGNLFGPGYYGPVNTFGGMPPVISGQPFPALFGRGQPMWTGQQGMMPSYRGVNPFMVTPGMNPMMVGGGQPTMVGMNPMMMNGINPMMYYGMGSTNPFMMGMNGPTGMYGTAGMNPFMMGTGGMGGVTPAAGIGGMMLPTGF